MTPIKLQGIVNRYNLFIDGKRLTVKKENSGWYFFDTSIGGRSFLSSTL